MNHNSAVLIREFEEDTLPRKKKRKNTVNPLLCSSLDNIGRHVPTDDGSACKYCGETMIGMRVVS